jgi:hypothetical protein
MLEDILQMMLFGGRHLLCISAGILWQVIDVGLLIQIDQN